MIFNNFVSPMRKIQMGRNSIVAGTGFEGRAQIIRKHCKEGLFVQLIREPNNPHDPNAIAVHLSVPKFFGLMGQTSKKIGYIKASTAKSLAKKMDAGMAVRARIKSFYAPSGKDIPRVSLRLDY
ncbi:MAG: HIRAN domain-containing protein [Magnetovibrio sp.]|nr:HIRAN domain-containing protein [Magnetovibrio sp.]